MSKEAEHSVLEYSTFRVPYEELNRQYRNGQKNIEKTASAIKKAAAAVRSQLGGKEPIPVENIKEAFQTLAACTAEFEKHVEETTESEIAQIRLMKERVEYLKQEDEITDESTLEYWKKKKMIVARMSIWYLLRSGHIRTAKIMAENYQIENLVDIAVFENMKLVETALRAGNSAPCLEWIDMHRSKLRRMKSKLEMAVRTQEVVSLIVANRLVDALEYVRKCVVPGMRDDLYEELQAMMSKFLTRKYPYAGYSDIEDDVSRWKKVAGLFVDEMFQLYQLPYQSTFSMCLMCGLSAHKTPSCHYDERSNKDVQCYVCDKTVWPLAQNLPNAHVSHSTILCSLTGEECNEDNLPYIFPNGEIYGSKAIASLTDDDQMVTCPRSNRKYPITSLQRLYFL